MIFPLHLVRHFFLVLVTVEENNDDDREDDVRFAVATKYCWHINQISHNACAGCSAGLYTPAYFSPCRFHC